MSKSYQQAIVIGGSIAGLLAARALANHFEHITIIERDHLPDSPEIRSGVPQAHHLHVLLARGHAILEEMFPGLDAELDAAGAPLIELGYDTGGLGRGGWMPKFHSGITTRSASRALLEWKIRQRLMCDYPIEFLPETQVNNLLANEDRTRIIGMDVQARGGGREQKHLLADLVVDASGRGSHTPDWLKDLGYDTPAETHVNSFLGYSTRWYKKPAGFQDSSKGYLVYNIPPKELRGGGFWEVEGGQWVVTLAGVNRDYPPTDEVGFLEFARSLRANTLYEAIKDAEPISEVYGYQRTDNILRHYERLSRFPEGFVVLGDAVCAFNPVYGQGMTNAAMGAQELDQCLREQSGELYGIGMRFQKRLAKSTETVWWMATGEDLRYPGTEGERPGPAIRLAQKYLDQVQLLVARDTDTATTFFKVTNLLESPFALFHPRIAIRLLRLMLSGGLSARATTSAPHLQPIER